MKAKQQKHTLSNSFLNKQSNRSFTDTAIIKNTSFIQQRLKKEIMNKFSFKETPDQINKSATSLRKKSMPSLLTHNPLTKTVFSMNDTITHKAALRFVTQQNKKPKEVLSSHKKINASYREKYSNSVDQQFFRTRIESAQKKLARVLKPSESARQFTKTPMTTMQPTHQTLKARNNKFKLLFREKNDKFKSASQRKISRIDSRLQSLSSKKNLFQSLLPKEKAKVVSTAPKPRGEIVKKQKIMAIALSLIKFLELYFNMYSHNNIVGGQLKKIQGYNNRIKSILMLDMNRAKRITNIEQITNHFWIYKDISIRPQYFGEEDLALYNILNGFLLKMEKKYSENIINYNYFQQKKKSQQKQSLQQTYQKYQKNIGKHDQINKINKFMQTRLRHQQDNREGYMQNLQKRGVKLNLIQRSRQLILRQKQKAAKLSLKKTVPL